MMSGLDARTVTGHVKWFDSAKGYGFVKPSDGEADILLHQSCVRHSGFKTIREGATVVCEAVPGPRGLQATKVVSLDNSTAQAPPAVSDRQKRGCHRTAWSGIRCGRQMVQPRQGLRLCVARPRHTRYFRPYGDAAPLRHRGTSRRPDGERKIGRWDQRRYRRLCRADPGIAVGIPPDDVVGRFQERPYCPTHHHWKLVRLGYRCRTTLPSASRPVTYKWHSRSTSK